MNLSLQTKDLVTQTIQWVYSSYNKAKPNLKSGPDREIRHPEWTRRILNELGHPDKRQYNIAITGSKGKGSHAIILAGMLQKLGFRVGLFTSPHLVDFLERFRLNGRMISETSFLESADSVRTIAERFELPIDQYIGPVGLLAAMAVSWFAKEMTDVNVFELGRGALHDDVNQVHHRGAVVSPVFLEHKAELGPTLCDVCREKAGVVTDETKWVVSYTQCPEMVDELSKVGGGVDIGRLNNDFFYQITMRERPTGSIPVIEVNSGGSAVYISVDQELLPYAGNVAVAWAAARNVWSDLRPGEPLPETLDLCDVRLPGRLDVIQTEPLRVIDGTVHHTNATLVREWIVQRRKENANLRFGAILGIPSAKDGQGVIDVLRDQFEWIVFARAHNPHLQFSDELASYARLHGQTVYEATDIEGAIALVNRLGFHEHGICLLGTQSFIGDALRYFQINTQSIWKSDMVREGTCQS